MMESVNALRRIQRWLRRAAAAVLLVSQAAGAGAVTLAHARDVVTAPATVEASHDSRCPVLHDALRCALCQYAGARVVVQQTVVTVPTGAVRVRIPRAQRVVAVASPVRYTAPPRAPPFFS